MMENTEVRRYNERKSTMALIICSECGKQFSNKAKACPNCCCPTDLIENNEIAKPLDNTDSSLTSQQDNQDKTPSHNSDTSHLMSYHELLEFAFTSILPYIEKELNSPITNIKSGTKNLDDVHYYIHCNDRTIGIKIVIDVYPDIYNVGHLFNDNRSDEILTKEMNNLGYDFAVANIGIGAADPIRFSRRILLKNDRYYFNYTQLQFHNITEYIPKPIRYSLSAIEPDHEWKTLAGFNYTKPVPKPNPNSYMLIQRNENKAPTKQDKSLSNIKFWKDENSTAEAIRHMFEKNHVTYTDADALNQLIRIVAHTVMDHISLDDTFYYTCNAIDFINGNFLADSSPIKKENIIISLRNLIDANKSITEYAFSLWQTTAINYLIYLFCFDRNGFTECVNGYYSATKPDDIPNKVIYEKIKSAFLENPTRFGYGQEVIDEIIRLQNMNSPQNLAKYESMKAEIKSEMKRFCKIHNDVIVNKYLKTLDENEEKILNTFRQNADNFLNYIKREFDDNLSKEYKNAMASFTAIVNAYTVCLRIDKAIISNHNRGKYGIFQKRSDIKESRYRYEQFVLLL